MTWISYVETSQAPLQTYSKVLDVMEDLVVKCEIITGDDINTSILLDLPMSETETLGFTEELFLRYL
jgi:hypothetical protein